MEQIEDYIAKTKSAVNKIFEAHNSYFELMSHPQRPSFSFMGSLDSNENKIAYEKWLIENMEILDLRRKRDDEFVFELFAKSTLGSAILQFAYNGIKLFSQNKFVPENYKEIIKPDSIAVKFCIGRHIDDVPIGLIIFAGRNQSAHYDDKILREPSKTIFFKSANYYSPKFGKWFVDSYFDLNNENIINYADNLLYKLGWSEYINYENDMFMMLQNNKCNPSN